METRKIAKTPSAYDYQLLIKNLLPVPLIYSPNQEIVYSDKLRYNYTTFKERLGRLANALKHLGIRPGNTVAVMDWDSHRYLECFFAIPMMGAVLHTINIRLSPEQMLYTINHAEDDVIIVNSEFLPLLEPIRDKILSVKKIILISDEPISQPGSIEFAGEYEELISKQSIEYPFPDFDENTMATLFYTTGTTGLPKGVYFSHRQLVLHSYAHMSAFSSYKMNAQLDSSDVYMPITPMFHVHAWGWPYTMTALGAKQVYPGRYEPEKLLELIDKEKVTFTHCVPTIVHMLLNQPRIKNMDLSNWKVIIGGSALSKGLCKEAMKYGINIYSGYGMSETCPMLTYAKLSPEMLDWELEEQIGIRCKAGVPVPGVYVNVIDGQGNPLPHDGKSAGEVVARGPWLTMGYLKEPEKSEELWKDGWLHTGDIGHIDNNGYLQITDRIKDVIKSGGEWVSSLELEDIISQHEAVSEAAVIGVSDEKWGERPLAMVVLKEAYKDKVSEKELIDFYRKFYQNGIIPKYGIPHKIVIAASIPKTSVGKIDKKVLRRDYST
jgi:fatty-acyl-CoA synthase